jgi:dynein heavy chain
MILHAKIIHMIVQVGNIVDVCVYIHQSVEKKSKEFYEELRRFNYVTPTSYLELLMCFIKLLVDKRDDLEGLKGRLSVGLDKLLNTADEVAILQEELVLLQPILVISTKEAEDMMTTISIDQADAAITKEQVYSNIIIFKNDKIKCLVFRFSIQYIIIIETMIVCI